MKKSYYILSEENNWFPMGCIFETTEKHKLLCLDNKKMCENVTKVFEKCLKIDRKSAILLQSIPLMNRIHLLKNENWIAISELDVGDECFYILNGQNIPCKIISKELGKNGLDFTVETDSGKKCNLKIDRLQNIKDLKVHNATERITPLTSEPIVKCQCLHNIFQKAHSLDLTLKSKESLFKSLFKILPPSTEDDNKRSSLHWGCHYLAYNSVENLLNIDDCKNQQDGDGNVPLFLAITSPLAELTNYKENLEKVVLSLLKHEADISIKNNSGETPLTKVIKNGNFRLFEFMLENYPKQLRLSDHLLPNKISILELLIKLGNYKLASLCCKKSGKENIYFIKSAYLALIKGIKDLCMEILLQSTDINEKINSGDTFLTLILTNKSINSENICFLLNGLSFNFDICNNKNEYPLNLSCRRLKLDVINIICNKGFVEISRINEALEETIIAYNEHYINIIYKNITSTEFQSLNEIKQSAIAILNVLAKNGASIENANPSILNSIENCVDNDFVKILRHICHKSDIKSKDFNDGIIIRSQSIETTNQCAICMFKPIDCVFLCGHTCCLECGEKIFECHACRTPITERRKIFL